jgi:PPM family protein phosphatase
MGIIAFGITDQGRVRANNEDSVLVDDGLLLYAVADGMGGHKGGEVASHMALDILRDSIVRSNGGNGAILGSVDKNVSREANLLASGIRLANRAIFEAAGSNQDWQGMGTTVAAVLINNGRAGIAHVGDSRIYLLREGTLRQLTNDHSLVAEQLRQGLITAEEAEISTRKNVITRALGQQEDVIVDLQDLELVDGDRLLLCSDGLSGMLKDVEIEALLKAHPVPENACSDLVGQANANGGRDNVTVVVIEYLQKQGLVAGLKKFLNR